MTIHKTDVGAPQVPGLSERVQSLVAEMTLDEKLAQLVGYWVDQVTRSSPPSRVRRSPPPATRMPRCTASPPHARLRHPAGRPDRARRVAVGEQRRLQTETRLGIPAHVHEECLTGFAAWKAATFPTPLAWGASFDPETVELVASAIGRSMREVGVHQGLAPVLDVVRDPRWGRVDECIAEDPYVVGTIGTAYVRGLQSAGVHATLKHFVGYSGSRAGRNHAPVHAGPRELQDVFLPPFEMAVRDGGVRSVMNSYAEIDGVPVAASADLLTDLLRRRWGFDGTVVSDYFAVDFLRSMHGVAATPGEAAQIALEAGIDVELPGADAYPHLAARVASGDLPEAVIDRAVARLLAEKEDLGLLDADFSTPPRSIDLDDAEHRALAYRLAIESAVLLRNDGVLPLAALPRTHRGHRAERRQRRGAHGLLLVREPRARTPPGVPDGLRHPDGAGGSLARFRDVVQAEGVAVEGTDADGIPAAVELARSADVPVVVVGDRAGLFGRGTVGEGNDADSLELPGLQRRLVEEVVATGTPVVMVLLTGRPYALGWALDSSSGPAAVVQAFFPGEEGGPALAALLAGDATPSGRLPVSLPGPPVRSRIRTCTRSSAVPPRSPAPTRPPCARSASACPTRRSCARPGRRRGRRFERGLGRSRGGGGAGLRNHRRSTRRRRLHSVSPSHQYRSPHGADVVQLYAHRAVASVTRPVAQLVAYARVELDPGETAECGSPSRHPVWRTATARSAASSNPARSSCASGRRAPRSTRPCPFGSRCDVRAASRRCAGGRCRDAPGLTPGVLLLSSVQDTRTASAGIRVSWTLNYEQPRDSHRPAPRSDSPPRLRGQRLRPRSVSKTRGPRLEASACRGHRTCGTRRAARTVRGGYRGRMTLPTASRVYDERETDGADPWSIDLERIQFSPYFSRLSAVTQVVSPSISGAPCTTASRTRSRSARSRGSSRCSSTPEPGTTSATRRSSRPRPTPTTSATRRSGISARRRSTASPAPSWASRTASRGTPRRIASSPPSTSSRTHPAG